MNFKYTALILASIVAIGTAQSPEATAYLQRFNTTEALVCPKPPTDDQLKGIDTQCKCDAATEKTVGEMVKACTKATDLTPKLMISSFCGDVKTCMVKNWTDILSKMKPEEITTATKTFDTYIDCIKKVLKV